MSALPEQVPITINTLTKAARDTLLLAPFRADNRSIHHQIKCPSARPSLCSEHEKRHGVAQRHANKVRSTPENLSYHTGQQIHSYATPPEQQNESAQQVQQAEIGRDVQAHPNIMSLHSRGNPIWQHFATNKRTRPCPGAPSAMNPINRMTPRTSPSQ